GLVRHEADPVEPRRVKQGQTNDIAYDDDRRSERQRDPRPANERPGKNRRNDDAMQNAEGDEGLWKRDVARRADQNRARRDNGDASPEMRARHAGAIGEHQAHADQQQEHAEDQRTKAEPERIVVEVGPKYTEPVQVEQKV